MRTLLTVGAVAALTIGLGSAAAPIAQAAPSDYTIELLPPVAGARSTKGSAINEAGDVAGMAFLNGKRADVLWRATDRARPVLIVADGYLPAGIADNGVVVGNSYPSASYFWKDGKLSTIHSGVKGGFQGVSANGVAVDRDGHLWTSPTARTALPTTGGGVSSGDTWTDAISRNGNHVVGQVAQGSKVIAVRWTNRKLEALSGTVGAAYPQPEAVNDAGVVVGATKEPKTRPVIWATKIKATTKGAGSYTYTTSNEWVFNNIVLFS